MWQRTRVTGALGLAVLVVSVFAVRTSIGRADTIAAVVVRATIPIDRHAGEMLTPPPPDVMPALTPEQAFAEYERQSGEPLRAIPANNTVRLGLLTSPIGAPPTLAYGYAWSPCRHHARPKVLSPPNPCTWWLFVDATTGQMIEAVLHQRGSSVPPEPPSSAEQLEHGRWVSMPAAPFRLCDPVSVWDGRSLVVVEPGVRSNGWCPARAAAYNPRTNSWRAMAAPPDTIGAQAGAWGGGRLVLIAARNGKAVSWSAADGRWHQLGRTPYGGIPSITWTGRGFLVIMIRGMHARPFMLTGNRWAPLPGLPQPATGSIVEAAAAVSHGALYVLADVAHVAPPSGYVELFRLTDSGWTRMPMSAGAPSSHFTLSTVAGGILADGSACPGKGGCTVDLEALAILRPGAAPDVIPLHTRPGVPAPVSIAAGADAAVVTNPLVPGFSAQPPTRKCLIYDLTTGTWHRGPDTPHSQAGLGTYWTPYGIISLGQFGSGGIPSTRVGGWLLRPARQS